jgi:thymidylate synthase (FAD)
MAENTNPLIGKEIAVLDKGFVRLIDYMGSDDAIVEAARVSYGKGTKKVREDRRLIRYLMRHQHTTPFEMVELKFHVKLPIFVARQWIRHRTASVNEYSGRYSVMEDHFYLPQANDIKYQSTTNRQGRDEREVDGDLSSRFIEMLNNSNRIVYDEYLKAIDAGIAREIARINLPISLYTQWYWKIDLHNLFHFLKLRLDQHAQAEIREYASAMASIVKEIVPVAWEAFEDYQLNAHRFSALELRLMMSKLGDLGVSDEDLIAAGLSKGEAAEFRDKIDKIKRAL